nr:uncharacterized protein LOC128684411 [Cherax quadricarinatus]
MLRNTPPRRQVPPPSLMLCNTPPRRQVPPPSLNASQNTTTTPGAPPSLMLRNTHPTPGASTVPHASQHTTTTPRCLHLPHASQHTTTTPGASTFPPCIATHHYDARCLHRPSCFATHHHDARCLHRPTHGFATHHHDARGLHRPSCFPKNTTTTPGASTFPQHRNTPPRRLVPPPSLMHRNTPLRRQVPPPPSCFATHKPRRQVPPPSLMLRKNTTTRQVSSTVPHASQHTITTPGASTVPHARNTPTTPGVPHRPSCIATHHHDASAPLFPHASQHTTPTPGASTSLMLRKTPNTTPEQQQQQQQQQQQTVEQTVYKTTSQHPDIDAGWAWVVLFAMFCVFALNSGLLSTTGMYFVQMLTEFGKSRSYTAWMGSLVNAFFMLGGPISSMFIQRWGCRLSLMFGSLLMTLGFLVSAFATSLEMLFVTYGVVVACGMNFAYSGQIISLAQYFDKRQSIATSSAMIGIGVGIFLLSSLTEFLILEYGWRGSFIWNAGLSLHIAVFGSLVFPIEPMTQNPGDTVSLQEHPDGSQSSILVNRGFSSSKSRIFLDKTMNDRSNGYSFCNKDSHAELSHFDLRSYQFSFHNKDSHGDFGLHSNYPSFSSHRDAQAGVSGIKSNPQSFCRTSQLDLYQQLHSCHHSEREVESLKATGSGYGGGRARFLVREGDCDLSCCDEEEEEQRSLSDVHTATPQIKRRSLCVLLMEKMKLRSQTVISSFARKSTNHPLFDVRFWLMDFAVFFAMLGTLCLYIIYKDFADYMGLGDYYSIALSGIGIGDLCGRMFTGFLMNMEWIDSVFAYGMALLLCAVVVVGHMFITTSTQLLVLTGIFGFLYGGQNVLIAVAPSMVFGREKLITVFGHILFLGGIGALIGAPIAGSIVDSTGSYDGVVLFSTVSLASGTLLMFICYFIHRKRCNQQPVESV